MNADFLYSLSDLILCSLADRTATRSLRDEDILPRLPFLIFSVLRTLMIANLSLTYFNTSPFFDPSPKGGFSDEYVHDLPRSDQEVIYTLRVSYANFFIRVA